MDNLENTGREKSRESEASVMERDRTDKLRLRAMNGLLLDWYKSHARVLPWREDPTPYRVWISEIMLQQTRVEAVKPFFERFLAALPELSDLAAVDEDYLMKLWQGLGYYNRARNLKRAAIQIMEQYGGQMPDSYEELLALPGIGSYTAGAIASIAFGKAVPAVDGNVLRVLSRLLGSYDDILKQTTKKRMEGLLRETMPDREVSPFNQGLIEIGAIVCVPNGAPHCGRCPLASICIAKEQSLIGELPVKTPAKKRKIENRTVCILESEADGTIAVHKREADGLLASLYELPNVIGHLKESELSQAFGFPEDQMLEAEVLSDAKHIFSHIEWHMIGYRIRLKGPLPDLWIAATRQELKERYALPNAFQKYTKTC